MLTIDNVYKANQVLKKVARKTDIIHAPKLCPGCDLYLKTENLQITGSFKVRGAYYKMSKLTAEENAQLAIQVNNKMKAKLIDENIIAAANENAKTVVADLLSATVHAVDPEFTVVVVQ